MSADNIPNPMQSAVAVSSVEWLATATPVWYMSQLC